ncbi:MAG TPA: response regulator, partial [Chitinophagaceae bacterium]|nr:response regulator [Chitinophagaceae bacterium]
EKIIYNTGLSIKITLFQNALEALELVKQPDPGSGNPKTIIIVDIQMPLMNGFEFIEAFEALPAETQAKYLIFMLSSTINQNDVNRAKSYKSVISLIGKPLSVSKILSMVEDLPGEQ